MPINNRHLSEAEIAQLPASFTRSFSIHDTQLIDRVHNPFAKNKIVCRGPRLYWPNHPKDFTRQTLIIQSLLIHELCHVWQYETGRLTAFRYLIDPRNWIYSYEVKENAEFDDYPTEKQADLLQDWFLVNSGNIPLRYALQDGLIPTKEWLNAVVPFRWDAR
ncbi:MAG: hypothetical protein ABJN22_06140 [Litorimonas sp.]